MMSKPITIEQLRPHYQTEDRNTAYDDKNTAYYDNVFTKILAGNIWQANFVSAFFPVPWMLYRRMYTIAFTYNIALSIILSVLPNNYALVIIPINILIMLFAGNLFYFRTLTKKISHPPSNPTDSQTCIAYLLASIAMIIFAQYQSILVYAVEIVFWTWVYLYRRKPE